MLAARALALLVLLAAQAVAGSAMAEEALGAIGETRFEGYPNAPTLDVVSRKNDLFFYPCDQCHATMEPNPEIRELDTFHDSELEHGRGRIWCMSCHDLVQRDYLTTLLGERVDFDDADVVCGGCHANEHKDWTFGIHGKRVANWQGARTQYSCAHCHNPHSPAIEPRAPSPAPPVRAGLSREGHGKDAGAESEERAEQ